MLAPLVRQQKGEYRDLFEDLSKQGFARARVDGRMVRLNDALQLDRQMRHDIEVVVDRLVIKPGLRPRLAEAVEQALKLGHGTLTIAVEDSAVHRGAADSGVQPEASRPAVGRDTQQASAETPRETLDKIYSAHYACTDCGISFEPPSPQLFSFNSPQGMCPGCDGLGQLYSFDPQLLIPDDSLSFKQGAIEILGPWKELGRWRRHIYQGVAETVERWKELPVATMLDTRLARPGSRIAAIVAVGNRSPPHYIYLARRRVAHEVRRSL